MTSFSFYPAVVALVRIRSVPDVRVPSALPAQVTLPAYVERRARQEAFLLDFKALHDGIIRLVKSALSPALRPPRRRSRKLLFRVEPKQLLVVDHIALPLERNVEARR